MLVPHDYWLPGRSNVGPAKELAPCRTPQRSHFLNSTPTPQFKPERATANCLPLTLRRLSYPRCESRIPLVGAFLCHRDGKSRSRYLKAENMANISVLFGLLLTILGAVGYFPDGKSPTALIPAYAGLSLILLGFIAYQESARKHAMHAAAAVALIGFLAAAWRAITKLRNGAEFDKALTCTTIMAILCGVFVALCVKSFIDARRRRKEGN